MQFGFPKKKMIRKKPNAFKEILNQSLLTGEKFGSGS